MSASEEPTPPGEPVATIPLLIPPLPLPVGIIAIPLKEDEQVGIHIHTPAGVTFAFLDADNAEKVGQDLIDAARACRSSFKLPQPARLIVP